MNDMAVHYTQHRFTIEEYHRMGDAGVLEPGARIELIDGELIESLVTMKPPHAKVVRFLTKALTVGLEERAILGRQVPVTLGDVSEPEPDFSVVLPPASRYDRRHPGPEDIICLLEVSDSSRAFDLVKKVPLYARFAVPEVWIVDLADTSIKVFREPHDGLYRQHFEAKHGDMVSPTCYPDIMISVSDIFE